MKISTKTPRFNFPFTHTISPRPKVPDKKKTINVGCLQKTENWGIKWEVQKSPPENAKNDIIVIVIIWFEHKKPQLTRMENGYCTCLVTANSREINKNLVYTLWTATHPYSFFRVNGLRIEFRSLACYRDQFFYILSLEF